MCKPTDKKSLFLLVAPKQGKNFGGLYEVKLDEQHSEGVETQESQLVLQNVAQFSADDLGCQGIWKFCTLDDKIDLLPDGTDNELLSRPEGDGYIFDMKARKLVSTITPPSPKWLATHVSAYGKIYSLTDPCFCTLAPKPSFEEYNPISESWKTLSPYPYPEEYRALWIQGYAVCDGIILFSAFHWSDLEVDDGSVLWAYDVMNDKWNQVDVYDEECYFRKQAVVVDETIYALSKNFHAIVKFSITRNQHREGNISYSICSSEMFEFSRDFCWHTNHQNLISEDASIFYLIQNGFNRRTFDGRQSISSTKFEIEGGSKIHILSSIHSVVDLGYSVPFHIQLCFTRESEDVALAKEETITSRHMGKQVREQHQVISDPLDQAEIPLVLGY